MNKPKYLVGIDEAGRGPLAGPVSVGVAVVPYGFDWNKLSAVNDSKKLSEKLRESIYIDAVKLKKMGELDFRVSMVSAEVIDKIGISKAVARALARALKSLSLEPTEVEIKLDGLLKAPAEYKNQQTIIKGDASEKIIGLASIMAKVRRDQYMQKLATKPELEVYQLAAHKGYGTKLHCQAIKENGLSVIHRRSFCRSLIG